MTINLFLGDSVNFSFTNGVILKNSSAFEIHANNFSHFSFPPQSPVSIINRINTIFKARIQNAPILDDSMTPLKLRQFFTGQVNDLLNDIIDSENIDRSSLSVRIQGPNTAFLETEVLNRTGLPITVIDSLDNHGPTLLSKQINKLSFEQSLTSWVNDPSVTGNKAEAEKRIRTTYEEMEDSVDEIELDLEGLSLNSIPDAIGHLRTLNTLKLANNRLKALPVALEKCTFLLDIDADNNPELCFFPVTLAFLLDFNFFFHEGTLIPNEVVDFILDIQPFASCIGNSVIGFEMSATEGTAAQLHVDYRKLVSLVLPHLTSTAISIPTSKEVARIKGLAQYFFLKQKGFKENKLTDRQTNPLLLPSYFLANIPRLYVKLFEHVSSTASADMVDFDKVENDYSIYLIEQGQNPSAIVNLGKKSNLLGRGSSKIVTLALDLTNRKLTAIAKTSLDPSPENAAAVATAENEIKILNLLPKTNRLLMPDAIYSRLNKKGIRKQYAFLPLCAGGSLTNALDRPIPTKVRLALNTVQGLRVLHKRGIAHQDIKPSNILITAEGTAKLGDFGVSAVVGEATELPVQGTTPYMSPDKLRHFASGKNYPSALALPEDIWALGKVFYELFYDPNSYAALYASAPPTDYNRIAQLFEEKYTHDVNMTISAPWGFIHSMMDPNPQNRPEISNTQVYTANLNTALQNVSTSLTKRKLPSDDEVIVTAAANPRTLLMAKKLRSYDNYDFSKMQIDIGGDRYQVITSEFVHFANHGLPLVSCGSGGRELLTLDPEQDPCIKQQKRTFHQLALIHLDTQNMSTFTPEELCSFALEFVGNVMTSTEIGPVMNKYTTHESTVKVNNDPCIPLGAFLKAQCGVCRHHALFTAYLLDDFIKNKPNLCSFQATLQIMRDDTKSGGAHAWVTLLTNKNQMFSIDTVNKILGDMSDPQFLQSLKEIWGEQVVDNQFSKIKHLQEGRKPVATNNNDDDGE